MSKYVPSFLKSANRTAVGGNHEEKPAAPFSSTTAPSAAASFRSFVAKEDPVVVNTSLPARLATPLPPATLASLTLTEKPAAATAATPLEPMRMAARRAPLPTDDDFPTLGKKAPVAKPAAPAAMSFRELSKDWAQKQKADAEEAAAKKEKERIAALQAMKEAGRSERDTYRIVSLGAINRTDGGSSEEEDEKSPVEDTTEPSDCDDYDDDEEEEVDDDWGTRKHRNELY